MKNTLVLRLSLVSLSSAFLALPAAFAGVRLAHAEPAAHAAPAAETKPAPRVYHDPQVRYLVADMQLGGSPAYYEKWAKEEGDPDSIRALELWNAGVRVVDIARYERKDVTGKYGTGRRIVYRGSSDTVPGREIMLTSDLGLDDTRRRVAVADLTLGAAPATYAAKKTDATIARALADFAAGVRATNTSAFEAKGTGKSRRLVARGTDKTFDGAWVRLNSDLVCDEAGARYIMADMTLGGAPDFYRAIADKTHDPYAITALARMDAGHKVLNAADFERKKVQGKTLITYKGTERRIDGRDVKLSSD